MKLAAVAAGAVAIGALVAPGSARAGGVMAAQSASVNERERELLPSDAISAVFAGLRLQRRTLEAIAGSDAAEQAQSAWDARWGRAFEEMEQELAGRLAGWETRRAALERGLTRRAEAAASDARTAERTIEETRRAAGGDAPLPVLEYLLSFDPVYAGDGLAQWRDGLVSSQTTDGSGASSGLRLVIETPRSWLPVYSRGGGVVLTCRSRAGNGLTSLTLTVLPLDDDQDTPSPEDVRARAEREAGDPGATITGHGTATILGRVGATATSEAETTGRRGAAREVRKDYVVALDRHVVKIRARVGDRGDSTEELLGWEPVRAEFERVEPLLDELVNRLRLHSGP